MSFRVYSKTINTNNLSGRTTATTLNITDDTTSTTPTTGALQITGGVISYI
jgi:hypothetical protein